MLQSMDISGFGNCPLSSTEQSSLPIAETYISIEAYLKGV